MGTSISKDKGVAKDAGMTADSIRKCCGAIAAWLKSRRSDHSEEALPKGDDTREKPGERTSSEEDEDTDTPKPEYVERALSNASSDIVGSNGVAPDDRVAATAHLKAALEALSKQDKDAFGRAINSLVKFGINIDHLAKTTLEWVNAHPWETAAIIFPLILLACTPAILGAVGFTAGGIAAGSVAAGIQAGIGSITTGSSFAVLTSAAMGGYGAIIVFGSVWVVPTAVLAAFAAWKRWRGRRGGGESKSEDGDRDKDGNFNEGR